AAKRVIAVATAAMRDAQNGLELIERVRVELGLSLDLIDSNKEAYYGCLGGIRALPVTDGILFDVGGGSAQIVEFHGRRPGMSCSLPLGSLRLTEAFIRHDPPSKKEIHELRRHIRQLLDQSCLRRPGRNGVVVGIGGTARNLAKID